MARTEIWIVDDANPEGAWRWIGGYEGAGVVVPVYAIAAGVSATAGEAVATIAGKVTATASGTSSTTGTAVASTTSLGQYLALTGVANSYATIPDDAALDFAGSHTVRVRLRMPDWSPAIAATIVNKWPWSVSTKAWDWKISTSGGGYFQWTTTGSNITGVGTAAALSPAPTVDTIIWLQMELDASNRQITYSTHADQVSEPTTGWTQVGQSVAGSATGTLYSGSALVAVGGYVGGGAVNMVGDIFQLVLRNSSDTKVFQLDPDNWTSGSTWVTSTGQVVTLGAAATVEPEPPAPTSLVDEGFETGTTPWSFTQEGTAEGSVTLLTSGAPEGSKHLQFATTSAAANKYARMQETIALTDGDTFITEFWLRLPTGFYTAMTGAVQIAGFDPFPTLNYQCRIIIYDSDEEARVYINNDGTVVELTGSWAIPENQWVQIRWTQRISSGADGYAIVLMDDTVVASGSGVTLYTGSSDATRMRWGLVATADASQTNALSLEMDDIQLWQA